MASRPKPTALALFVRSRLRDRGETVQHFAERTQINPSGFGRFMRGINRSPHRDTEEKVAIGLGLTRVEMLSLAEGAAAFDRSESQAEVLARLPEFDELIRDLPRPFWSSVLNAALGSGKAVATNLTLIKTSEVSTRRVTPNNTRRVTANRRPVGPKGKITPVQPVAA